jgi:hypothetical protein
MVGTYKTSLLTIIGRAIGKILFRLEKSSIRTIDCTSEAKDAPYHPWIKNQQSGAPHSGQCCWLLVV